MLNQFRLTRLQPDSILAQPPPSKPLNAESPREAGHKGVNFGELKRAIRIGWAARVSRLSGTGAQAYKRTSEASSEDQMQV
jgi:hypothetical protein